jgi:hypothetical protein
MLLPTERKAVTQERYRSKEHRTFDRYTFSAREELGEMRHSVLYVPHEVRVIDGQVKFVVITSNGNY